VRRHDRRECIPLVFRRSGQRAILVKLFGIEQPFDPLAYRELAAVMLALDVIGPAHRFGELDAAADFFDFLLPRHAILPTDAIPDPINHADAFHKAGVTPAPNVKRRGNSCTLVLRCSTRPDADFGGY